MGVATQSRDDAQDAFDSASGNLDTATDEHTTVAGELSNAQDEVARLTNLKADHLEAQENAQDAFNNAEAALADAESWLSDETARIDGERATLLEIRDLLDTLLPASSKVRIGSDGVRAEILYNGVWGTICDDVFDNDDAVAFCSTLHGSPMPHSTVVGHTDTVDGSGPINVDDLECNGELNIFLCNGLWGSHNCGHHEDVGVDCQS